MVELVNLNKTNYAGDGVDRSRWQFDEDGVNRARWKFDENGFALAKDAAIEIARRRHILAAEAENRKMMEANNPSTAVRSVDGVENAPDSSFNL